MDTPAPILAGLAGALAVAGAWEALAAVEQAAMARTAARLLAPLRAVARTGRAPPRRAPPARAHRAATLLAAGWLLSRPVAGSPPRRRGLARRAVLEARRARWRADLGRAAPAAARAMADALAGGHAIRAPSPPPRPAVG